MTSHAESGPVAVAGLALSTEPGDWWGEFEFSERPCLRWRIGPLHLWVTRLEKEWQVVWRWSEDPLDSSIEAATLSDEPPHELERHRFLFGPGPSRVSITPRVADRPIVARPEMPVVIPAGLKATLYVASPLWLELSTGTPLQRFVEVPTWRPSSTWFGESTLEGTLCYATRTRARLSVGGVATPGPRVITAVVVNNAHREPLQIERIAMPIPQMSVFRDRRGALWTEQAVVDYDEDGAAPVRVTRVPPPEAGPTTLVSRSREPRESNIIARAFSAALRGVMP